MSIPRILHSSSKWSMDSWIISHMPGTLNILGAILRIGVRCSSTSQDLLATPIHHPGPVVMSGYTSQFYDETLSWWVREKSSQAAR